MTTDLETRHWCKLHRLSVMEVCHSWYGIPFLPFLARVAGMCLDPAEEKLASSQSSYGHNRLASSITLIPHIFSVAGNGRPRL